MSRWQYNIVFWVASASMGVLIFLPRLGFTASPVALMGLGVVVYFMLTLHRAPGREPEGETVPSVDPVDESDAIRAIQTAVHSKGVGGHVLADANSPHGETLAHICTRADCDYTEYVEEPEQRLDSQ